MSIAKKRAVGILIMAASAALSVVGYFRLPDTLVVQLTGFGKSGNTLPKPLGLLIPLAMSCIFSLLYMKRDDTERFKYLVLSILGIGVSVFLFVVNGRV